MKIIFWSEFPEQVDWDKVNKEIDFDTEIFIACRDKREFLGLKKKVRNKHISVGAWPVLDKNDGYWFSGQTSKENIDKLDEFKDIPVKLDIEPWIYHGRYGFWKSVFWLAKWVFKPGKNMAYLNDKINSLHKDSIVSGFSLPRFLRKRVGMDMGSRRSYICYTTLGPRLLLLIYYRFMIKRITKDNFFAIGLTNHGIFGNEPVYRNKEELVKDLEFMKKLWVKNIVVYSIEGIIKRGWLDVVKNHVNAF